MMPMQPMLQLGTKKDNTVLYVVIGAVAFILVGLIVVIVVMTVSRQPEHVAQSSGVDLTAGVENAGDGIAPIQVGSAQGSVATDTKNDAKTDAKPEETTPDPPKDEIKEPPPVEKPEEQNTVATDPTPPAPPPTDDKKKQRDPKPPRPDPIKDPKPPTKPPQPPKTDTPAKAPSGGGGNELTKAEIQNVIRASFGEVRTCSRTSDKKGTMNVSFVIKGNGRVANARVASAEFANTPAGACVLKVVNGLKFRETGGADVPINYPFSIQ